MRTSVHFCLAGLALGSLILATSGVAQAALIYGSNGIQNPGADQGPAGPIQNNTVVPVADWTLTQGSFTEVQYTSITGGQPMFTDPGPPDRGINLFSGGPNPDPASPDYVSQGDQILDVSNVAGDIDSGMVPFVLSGWLGGYFDQRDNAQFTAIFEDGKGNVISMINLGPVTLQDRTNGAGVPETELLFRSASGNIPVGTREIDFQLVMNGIDGGENDGYADSLSFVAGTPTCVPEPASMALLGLGLAGIGILSRRKTRS